MSGDEDGSWHDKQELILAAGVAGVILVALLVLAVIHTANKSAPSSVAVSIPSDAFIVGERHRTQRLSLSSISVRAMHQAKGVAAVAGLLVAAASVAGAAPAAADRPVTSGATSVPLTSLFRNCDFVKPRWVSASGTGSGSALIGRAGANQVSAHVNLGVAAPNTRYTVRLIQVPRAGDRTCTAGDPGVAVGELFTDRNGTGTATVQGPRLQGATGAWVAVDGPPPGGQVIGEFYTSEIIAVLS